MERRWLWWILAVMALTLFAGGAWWPVPGSGELHSDTEEPVTLAADLRAAGEACAALAGLEPVELLIRLEAGGPVRAGIGYRDTARERVLAPARSLVSPLAPGPLSVYWEEASRTATMLREGSVLSIHFPRRRDRSTIAIMNGEVVGAESVLCQDRLYVPLRLLTDGLGLRFRWRSARSILVEAR